MDNRKYNIIFDLHTVSGIVLSVLLFVIFFAGSFSFFRDEIVNWERNKSVNVSKDLNLNVDYALKVINDTIPLQGRDIAFERHFDERRVSVRISPSKDSLFTEAGKNQHFFYMDYETYQTSGYVDSYSLGEFLYRLHFLAQIPYPAGYYLSGFSALFLIFVLLTGILIHWKKIFSNFFVFRPGKKLKTAWTDAHTVLGTIGLPFQIVYAVTGAFFMIKILLLAPLLVGLYDGDEDKIYKDLGYTDSTYAYQYASLNELPQINAMIAKTKSKWQDFEVSHLHIQNYGDEGMHVELEGSIPQKIKYIGIGSVVYEAKTSAIEEEEDPYKPASYLASVKDLMYRLHFGDYAGYTLKFASFLLGLLSCVVIISGIMVWLEARNKKHISERKRKSNKIVGNIYLAICLSMFPVTAYSFIAVKLLNLDNEPGRQTTIYAIYFTVWLALALVFSLKRDNRFTNKYSILSGGILALLIPIANGIVSGNWFWATYLNNQWDIWVVDMLWIGIGLLSLYAVSRLKNSAINKKSKEDKNFTKFKVADIPESVI